MSCALIKCVAQAEPEAPAVLGGLTLEQVTKLKKEHEDMVKSREIEREQVAKLKKDREDMVKSQEIEREFAKLRQEAADSKKETEKKVSFLLASAELPMMLQFCNPDQLCI